MARAVPEPPAGGGLQAGTDCRVARLASVPAGARGGVPSLLIADPDDQHGRELLLSLSERGIQVIVCTDGARALLRIGALRPDAILVSANLPGVDPVHFIEAVRQSMAVPIVIGAGAKDGPKVVRALAAGATACVARPYRLPELLPLIHGISADEQQAGPPEASDSVLRCGPIELDRGAHVVRVGGRSVHMPLREFELLHYLLLNADRVVSRAQIQTHVWHTGAPTTNTISVHIRRLRGRLGDDPENPSLILTVRGLGYRLACE